MKFNRTYHLLERRVEGLLDQWKILFAAQSSLDVDQLGVLKVNLEEIK